MPVAKCCRHNAEAEYPLGVMGWQVSWHLGRPAHWLLAMKPPTSTTRLDCLSTSARIAKSFSPLAWLAGCHQPAHLHLPQGVSHHGRISNGEWRGRLGEASALESEDWT